MSAQFPGMKGWFKGLWRRERLVGTVVTAIGIIGGFFTVSDVATRLGAWAKDTEAGRFEAYIWVTFICTGLVSSVTVLLYASFHRDLKKAWELIRLGVEASKIQHHMAEAVRRCAQHPGSYDLSADLRQVMALLMKYLRLRLGDAPYAITVKKVERGSLSAVFRDDGQDRQRRAVGDRISLEESPVFKRFSSAPGSKKIVYIGDTEHVPVLEESFRTRARDCGYRTVVAFPLRMPHILPGQQAGPSLSSPNVVKVANLIGFFSIDAADVGMLDGLLTGGSRLTRDDDREPRDDLDVFYGLADSMATILMLGSQAATGGGGNR